MEHFPETYYRHITVLVHIVHLLYKSLVICLVAGTVVGAAVVEN